MRTALEYETCTQLASKSSSYHSLSRMPLSTSVMGVYCQSRSGECWVHSKASLCSVSESMGGRANGSSQASMRE